MYLLSWHNVKRIFFQEAIFEGGAGVSLVSRQEGNTPAVGLQRGPNICGQTTQTKRKTKIDFQPNLPFTGRGKAIKFFLLVLCSPHEPLCILSE